MSTNNSQYQYNYPNPPQMPPQGTPPPRPNPPPPPVMASLMPHRQTKNKFLTFVFALIPGAGQMYHGLYKKGISLMLLFWGTIAVSAITYLSVLNFLLPVIWFYSFFDAVNRMNMGVDEMRTLKDEYLFFGERLTERTVGNPLGRFVRERHVLIGVGLIVLAVWIFLNALFGNYWYGSTIWIETGLLSETMYYSLQSFVRNIPALIVPIFCIVLGIHLISSGKQKDSAPPPRYDEYTIPKDKKQIEQE